MVVILALDNAKPLAYHLQLYVLQLFQMCMICLQIHLQVGLPQLWHDFLPETKVGLYYDHMVKPLVVRALSSLQCR